MPAVLPETVLGTVSPVVLTELLETNYGLTLSNRKSRGNSFKLAVNVSRIDARKHFFAAEFLSHGILYLMMLFWLIVSNRLSDNCTI